MHPLGFNEQIATLAGLALLAVWSTSGIRNAHRRRQMEHIERLKALEMGVVPQAGGMDWPSAAVCIAIGAGVPIGSFLICWLATLTAHVPQGIWVAPVFVSFSAISAARKLAYRAIDPRSGAKKPNLVQAASSGKPEFDPDAYDVVGSRG